MLLREETKCFAFLTRTHESFAAAEGAIGIVKSANRVRKEPLQVILNGLGKDAAKIISRINGFIYVQNTIRLLFWRIKKVSFRIALFKRRQSMKVNCYGADDVREGVAILHSEGVDVSITGNSTNPYTLSTPCGWHIQKECIEQGKNTFRLLRVEALVVPSTPTIWLFAPVLLRMA